MRTWFGCVLSNHAGTMNSFPTSIGTGMLRTIDLRKKASWDDLSASGLFKVLTSKELGIRERANSSNKDYTGRTEYYVRLTSPAPGGSKSLKSPIWHPK